MREKARPEGHVERRLETVEGHDFSRAAKRPLRRFSR